MFRFLERRNMPDMNDNIRKPSAALTFEDAVAVQLLLLDGNFQNRIAAKFDVNPGRISEIKTGQAHQGSYVEALRRRNSKAA